MFQLAVNAGIDDDNLQRSGTLSIAVFDNADAECHDAMDDGLPHTNAYNPNDGNDNDDDDNDDDEEEDDHVDHVDDLDIIDEIGDIDGDGIPRYR